MFFFLSTFLITFYFVLISTLKPVAFTVCYNIHITHIHSPKQSEIISASKRSTSPHACWLFLPVMVAILQPANKLVQVCGELKLGNFIGIKTNV